MTGDYPQFLQELQDFRRLRTGQGQVVGSPRMGRNGSNAAAGIATGFAFKFQHHHVADGALSQRPCGGQSGDPAAQNDYVVPFGSIGRRQVSIAQSVPQHSIRTHNFAPKRRSSGASGPI